MIPRSRVFVAILVGLLAVNFLLSFLTGGAPERQRVPYQPFFVDQVKAGNVEEISSQANSIQAAIDRSARRVVLRAVASPFA